MRKKIIIKQLLSKIVILTTILARKCGNHLRRRAEKRGRKFCKRKESRSKNQNRSIESREAKQQSIHIQEQDHVYSHRFPYADTSHRFEEHVNRGRSRDNSFSPPIPPSLPFPNRRISPRVIRYSLLRNFVESRFSTRASPPRHLTGVQTLSPLPLSSPSPSNLSMDPSPAENRPLSLSGVENESIDPRDRRKYNAMKERDAVAIN